MSRSVFGVTQCDSKLFVVGGDSDTILVFGPNYERLPSITVTGLKEPTDIAACIETRQLFIADIAGSGCVWRVSLDGCVDKWPTDKSTTTTDWRPWSLSVTSRRLLVTKAIDELLLLGPDGVELKRVSSPGTKQVCHAVETSRGTFIVSHREPQSQVSEVGADGHVIRVYCGQQRLGDPCYLALDSDGRVFVVDCWKHCVLLLNSRLELERVLLDSKQHQLAERPFRLCLDQQTRQLIVASYTPPGHAVSDLIQVYTTRDS